MTTKIFVLDELPPTLDSEETLRLIKEFQSTNDVKIQNQIISGNLRLVIHFAHTYSSFLGIAMQGYPSLDDLIQEGVICMMKALKYFNPEYNVAFSTYLNRVFLRHFARTFQNKGKYETFHTSSLQDYVKDGKSLTFEEFVCDEKFGENYMHTKADIEKVKGVLKKMPERQKNVFVDYCVNGLVLRKLGDKYGFSRTTACKLVERSRKQIVAAFEGKGNLKNKKDSTLTKQKNNLENLISIKDFGKICDDIECVK